MASDSLVTTISTPQFFYEIQSSYRFDAVCRILDEFYGKSVVIFCRTKKDVDHIADKLQLLNYKVTGYHGDLTPSVRSKSLKLFSSQSVQAILLTDLPATFDDIKHIDLVLFSAIPQDPDSYIQRILRLESEITINEVATFIHSSEYKKIAFIKRVTKSDIIERSFVESGSIIEQKKNRIKSFIDSFSKDKQDLDEDLALFSKELIDKFEPEQIVYGLLKQGFIRDIAKSSYIKLSNSKKSKSKNHESNAIDGAKERLFIAIGKADGINEDKLLDFLAKETNIDKQNFSQIKLFDTFSFFVVSIEEAEIVLEIFRRKKRGKRSIVERAKGKDSNNKKS